MTKFLAKANAWLQWSILQTYPMWLVLAVPLLAWPVVVLSGDSGLKFYALAVQLWGGWIATSVIRQNLQMFQAGGLKAAIFGWWSRRPRRRDITINVQGGSAAMTGGSARLRVNVGRSPDDSLETQMNKLWQSLQQLWAEVDSNRNELEDKLGVAHSKIQELKVAHDKRTNDLAEVVKKVAASSPLYAYFGAWMAAVGTVLSTYTQEIVKFVQS